MKEKLSIKNKNYQESKIIFLTNDIDITKELNRKDLLEIKDDNEITEELKNKYKYIFISKTIKFININDYNMNTEYEFRIILDINSYELIEQICLTYLLMSDSNVRVPVQINKDINKLSSMNILIRIEDPYDSFNTDDDYIMFKFDNGLQILYLIEKYLDDKTEIQNEDMIDSVKSRISLSNSIDFNNERYLTTEEITNTELTELINEYKFITMEKTIFTTNDLVYLLGVKYHENDNILAMYCNVIETDEAIDLIDIEYTSKKQKESGDLTTIYFKDPYDIFVPGDIIEVVISENTKVKFIVIDDEQEDYGIVEDNNVKNFLKDFFK